MDYLLYSFTAVKLLFVNNWLFVRLQVVRVYSIAVQALIKRCRGVDEYCIWGRESQLRSITCSSWTSLWTDMITLFDIDLLSI